MNGYYEKTKKKIKNFYGIKLIEDKFLMKKDNMISYLIETSVLDYLYDKFEDEVKYGKKTLNESQLDEVLKNIKEGVIREDYCIYNWTEYEIIYNEFYYKILEEGDNKVINFRPRNEIYSN